MKFAWPAAFAFAAMCAAIAAASIYSPPPLKDAMVVCIEQRGRWVNAFPRGSTCEFPPTSAMNK